MPREGPFQELCAPLVGLDGGMANPETFEVVRADGAVLRYCLYGPEGGYPVVSHNGTPSSRWKWPALVESMGRSGFRHLVYDRPGYGGSTRRAGRTVVDAVEDVRALVDAQGWERFAVSGGSGGAPHALACAALLGDRISACVVISGVKPAEEGTAAPEEAKLREQVAAVAAEIMGGIEEGAPELPGGPGPAARDDPEAMARLRVTFTDSTDGWVDDSVALARPWGFELSKIKVPVGLWRGTSDANIPSEDADYLLEHIPGVQGHVFTGGHLPAPAVYEEIYDWLKGQVAG
ncbi:alpha/beta fold hydrolase [Kribbella sp. NPDC051620]|uniref:alpha/beta fold hydrolase n=1 Tax=Kribbella sp. NPDC051620 TaxID=3364120 RepID=UPI00378C79E9